MAHIDVAEATTAAEALTLTDAEGNATKAIKVSVLDESRRAIYVTAAPQLGEGVALACLCPGDWEHVVHVTRGADGSAQASPVILECKITLEEFPPSQLVEYQYADGVWRLSSVCLPALEDYRNTKFAHWKHMLLNPTCEAAFRRLLKIGLITRMYDEFAFPESAEDRPNWEVVDERNGKTVHLPHPVTGLRVWDTAAGNYRALEPQLTGAPSDAEATQYWATLLVELEEKHGKEYLAELIAKD